jgi:hypothetical protein
MKSYTIILWITLLTFALSTTFGQSVKEQSNKDLSNIVVLEVADQVPPGAKLLKSVRAGGGLAECGYHDAVHNAKIKAKSAGGNVLKITEVRCPNGVSPNFKVLADIYSVEDVASIFAYKSAKLDSSVKSLIRENAPFALLYVYREKSDFGAMIHYRLHVEDSVVCNVANNSVNVVQVYHKGNTKIWARTEAQRDVNLFIEPGKVYFLKCSVGIGAFVGEPILKLMSAAEGYQEFFACPQ